MGLCPTFRPGVLPLMSTLDTGDAPKTTRCPTCSTCPTLFGREEKMVVVGTVRRRRARIFPHGFLPEKGRPGRPGRTAPFISIGYECPTLTLRPDSRELEVGQRVSGPRTVCRLRHRWSVPKSSVRSAPIPLWDHPSRLVDLHSYRMPCGTRRATGIDNTKGDCRLS
jgi:hypothetical protein